MDWGVQFLRECTPGRFTKNSVAKLHLCLYSAKQYAALCKEVKLEFDRREGGILFLHRDVVAFEKAARTIQQWVPHGLELKIVSLDEMVELEPSLAGKRDRFAGAIFSADDGSGDSAAFTNALAISRTPKAIEFRFNERILAINHQGDHIASIRTDRQTHKADCYVVAGGWESASLCAPLGMKLPIYPVKGCSATFTVRHPERAAQRGLIDEHNLVGIARLGNRMRFAGRAIFDYPNTEVDPRDFTGIEAVAAELYGDALDLEAKKLWACLRPMTPDGPPIIGETPYSNLFLNTGHGHIGWTMACGSAALLSQLINKQTPDIDLGKYSASRYWH
jgi:D-amino-acid dehydrogenase